MMKATDPSRLKTVGDTTSRQFWLRAYELLTRAVTCQAVACPTSWFHLKESLPLGQAGWEALDTIGRRLSGDLAFREPHEIQWSQLFECAKAWALGESVKSRVWNRQDAIEGDINAWCGTHIVSLDLTWPGEVHDELNQAKEQQSTSLRTMWDAWGNSQETFEQTFAVEVRGLRERLLLTTGGVDDARTEWLEAVQSGLEGAAADATTTHKQVERFIQSEALSLVPFVRISCLLFAALAHRVRNNQAGRPKASMANDMRMAAAFLPYCDAMFLDRELRAMLLDSRVAPYLPSNPRLFAGTNDDFLTYLENLVETTPPEVRAAADDLFGSGS